MPRRIVSEAGFKGGMMAREGPWKLISTYRRGYARRIRNELYDLTRDAEETHDLARREKDIAQHLERAVSTLLDDSRTRQEEAPAPVDPKQKEMLEALGYVE